VPTIRLLKANVTSMSTEPETVDWAGTCDSVGCGKRGAKWCGKCGQVILMSDFFFFFFFEIARPYLGHNPIIMHTRSCDKPTAS
jgi:hypothetical protein